MINAKSWKELKKQLRPLQGKAIFVLERHSSMNDGKFLRVLHQVKPHELVFSDGKQKMSLDVKPEIEQDIEFFENGFTVRNCKYTLVRVMEG